MASTVASDLPLCGLLQQPTATGAHLVIRHPEIPRPPAPPCPVSGDACARQYKWRWPSRLDTPRAPRRFANRKTGGKNDSAENRSGNRSDFSDRSGPASSVGAIRAWIEDAADAVHPEMAADQETSRDGAEHQEFDMAHADKGGGQQQKHGHDRHDGDGNGAALVGEAHQQQAAHRAHG